MRALILREQEDAARWVRVGQGEGGGPGQARARGLGPDVSIFGSVLRSAQRVCPVAQPRVGQLGALTNPDPEALEVASTVCPTDGAFPRWVLRVRRYQFSATCTWRGLSWHSGDARAVLGAGGFRLGVRHQRCGCWKGLASSWDVFMGASPPWLEDGCYLPEPERGKGLQTLGLKHVP